MKYKTKKNIKLEEGDILEIPMYVNGEYIGTVECGVSNQISNNEFDFSLGELED